MAQKTDGVTQSYCLNFEFIIIVDVFNSILICYLIFDFEIIIFEFVQFIFSFTNENIIFIKI